MKYLHKIMKQNLYKKKYCTKIYIKIKMNILRAK